jgi:hypothetical protein
VRSWLQKKFLLDQTLTAPRDSTVELSGRGFAGDYFVHVTPDPCFSRLYGTDKRMLAAMEVFGGVLVL